MILKWRASVPGDKFLPVDVSFSPNWNDILWLIRTAGNLAFNQLLEQYRLFQNVSVTHCTIWEIIESNLIQIAHLTIMAWLVNVCRLAYDFPITHTATLASGRKRIMGHGPTQSPCGSSSLITGSRDDGVDLTDVKDTAPMFDPKRWQQTNAAMKKV